MRIRWDATRRPVIAAALIVALGVGAGTWRGVAEGADPAAVAQAEGLSRAFREAAHKVIPTVVLIKTTTKPQRVEGNRGGPNRGRNPFQGTPFEDFFNDEMPGFRGHGAVPRQQGVGSGVLIDATGIILTNAHVVDDADEVTVELTDGRQFKATDIKADDRTDLAVVRIKAEGPLPFAQLGDSSKLDIGDWVIAVGNPFELEHTVSAGIISGLRRTLPSGKRAEYLQTDAAINPGNSGGPLVNLNGEVVGINTAIASMSGGYQGVGFAIPSNLAKWVTAQLIKSGSVARAYLGVGMVELSNEVAAKLGVRRNEGVLVTEVFPNAPAAQAGIQEGDVIVAFAGQPVGRPHQLQELVERSSFGSKQEVRVIRDRKPVTLSVEVKAMPESFGVTARRAKPERTSEGESFSARDLGLDVGELTPELAKQLGLEGQPTGVVITSVEPNGLAEEAGLREGMLITRVGKQPIKSVADFQKAVKAEDLKSGIMLLVRTPAGNRFVVLQQQ
jgi:serine protease Do